MIDIDGDNHLGGQDFDNVMMEDFIEQYKEEFYEDEDNEGLEPKMTPRIMARFK